MELVKKFTLLVPAFNPNDGWEFVFLKRYLEFCDLIQEEVNVVLINDGSTKDFLNGVEYLKTKLGNLFTYLSYDLNRGKGGALKYGAQHTDGTIYMFTDIDFPYSTESMKAVWAASQINSGIIIGQRATDYYTDLSSVRTFLSKGLKWLNKLLLNLPTNDTQCGLKAFDQDVKEILLQCYTDRFLIDLELLLAVNKKKINIVPIVVNLREDINFTKFNSSVLLKEVFNFLRLVWVYRIK